MKTIHCSQVGGESCNFSVTAETLQEAKDKFSAHASIAHKDMMEKSTPESMQEWNTMFEKVWESTPHN